MTCIISLKRHDQKHLAIMLRFISRVEERTESSSSISVTYTSTETRTSNTCTSTDPMKFIMANLQKNQLSTSIRSSASTETTRLTKMRLSTKMMTTNNVRAQWILSFNMTTACFRLWLTARQGLVHRSKSMTFQWRSNHAQMSVHHTHLIRKWMERNSHLIANQNAEERR